MSHTYVTILFIIMKYEKIFEGWRKFVDEQVRRLDPGAGGGGSVSSRSRSNEPEEKEKYVKKPARDYNMYFDNLASDGPTNPDLIARKSVTNAFNRAIRMLRKKDKQGLEYNVKIQIGGGVEAEGKSMDMDIVAMLRTLYSKDDNKIIGHMLKINPVETSEYFRKFFVIIDEYGKAGGFVPNNEAEIELIVSSAFDLVELLLLPTVYHEVLHARSHETRGKSLGVDISNDQNLNYFMRKGEAKIRRLEAVVIKDVQAEAQKIIFDTMLPIFLNREKTNKPEVINALMKILEYFKTQLKDNSNYFKTRKHFDKMEDDVEPLVVSGTPNNTKRGAMKSRRNKRRGGR